jgi:hypothetical protein
VEKAPVVIKGGLSKADAEAIQKTLETGEGWQGWNTVAHGFAAPGHHAPAAARLHAGCAGRPGLAVQCDALLPTPLPLQQQQQLRTARVRCLLTSTPMCLAAGGKVTLG